MKSIFITMVVVIFFVTAMIFSANNTRMVTINYFIAQGDFNISHVIGVAFLFGFLICWVIFVSFYLTMKFKLRLVNKKLIKLETQAITTPLVESTTTNNV